MWVICGEIVAGCLTYLAYFIGTRFLDYNEIDLWCLCFIVFSVILDYVMYVLFYGPSEYKDDARNYDENEEEDNDIERFKNQKKAMYDSLSNETKERLDRIDGSNKFNQNDYGESSNRKKGAYTMSNLSENSNPLYKLFKFIFLIVPFGFGLFMLFVKSRWIYYNDMEWTYTLFKVLVIVDAIILVALRLHFKQFLTFTLSIATVTMCAMSVIAILSFSDSFDFSSEFWKFLDGIFALIKLVLYIQIRKVESELD